MGELVSLSVHHPDERIAPLLAALGLDKVNVSQGPAHLSLVVQTPNGRVELR